MFNSPILRAGAATIATVMTITAVAVAAAPTKGGSYGDCKLHACKVNDIQVSKNGKTIALFRAFTKCNLIPFTKDPGGFKITKAGTFAFTGVKRDFNGHSVKVVITGKFVSSKLIRERCATAPRLRSAATPKRSSTRRSSVLAAFRRLESGPQFSGNSARRRGMMPYLLCVLRSALARCAALFACALSIVFAAPAVAASPSAIVGYYNALRSANGIPGDLTLDAASAAKCALHNHYAALNGNDYPNPHQETPGKPGYTTDGDWAARNSELAGGSGLVSAFAPFDRGRPYWSAPFVNAPFHLMGLLNPSNTTLWGADTEGGLCIGEGGARPVPAADTLYSFPGTGTSIPWSQRVQGEYPTSPGVVAGIPDGTLTGPLLIAFWRGPSDPSYPPLDALTSATLTGPSGPVPIDIVSTQQSALVPGGAGFVIPTSPLLPGAHYTASVTFSTAPDVLPNRSWSRSFSFTTTGPPSASSLVHVDAVTQPPHRVVFAMTADFPAAGEPATLSVKSSNPCCRSKAPPARCRREAW